MKKKEYLLSNYCFSFSDFLFYLFPLTLLAIGIFVSYCVIKSSLALFKHNKKESFDTPIRLYQIPDNQKNNIGQVQLLNEYKNCKAFTLNNDDFSWSLLEKVKRALAIITNLNAGQKNYFKRNGIDIEKEKEDLENKIISMNEQRENYWNNKFNAETRKAKTVINQNVEHIESVTENVVPAKKDEVEPKPSIEPSPLKQIHTEENDSKNDESTDDPSERTKKVEENITDLEKNTGQKESQRVDESYNRVGRRISHILPSFDDTTPWNQKKWEEYRANNEIKSSDFSITAHKLKFMGDILQEFSCPILIYMDTTGGEDSQTEYILRLIIKNLKSKEIIFNEMFKPGNRRSWQDASSIHGIYSEDVKDKKRINVYADEIEAIMSSADYIAGYQLIDKELPVLSNDVNNIDLHMEHTVCFDIGKIESEMQGNDWFSLAFGFDPNFVPLRKALSKNEIKYKLSDGISMCNALEELLYNAFWIINNEKKMYL